MYGCLELKVGQGNHQVPPMYDKYQLRATLDVMHQLLGRIDRLEQIFQLLEQKLLE
jgi:hypothetical protein